MNRRALAATFLFALLAGVQMAAAANHDVQVGPGFTFSPANLTIQAGDSVTWTNAGGLHNVAADDNSFRCANGCDSQGGSGEPAANGWSFTLTFNDPGVIGYDCEIHVPQGMVGTLTVEEAPPPDEPGDLRFAQESTEVGEGAGSVRISVQRINGDDGAVSVAYGTGDGSADAGDDYTATSGTLSWDDNDDDSKTFTIPILDDGDDENDETINLTLSGPTGGAGLGNRSTAEVTILDDEGDVPDPGNLGFVSTNIQADEDAGSVTVTVDRSSGNDGAVSVDYATGDGSAEDGSDYDSAAGTLSWSDGDGSPKSFSVDVTDDTDDEGNETVNLMLSNPSGGATLGPGSATLTIVDDDQVAEACSAGDETLCLNKDGRFKVEVDWRTGQGTGAGKAFDIGKRDSGLFFFFNENNIEMLIKILDACTLGDFNSFWVFYAATTDVELTVTVTDTRTGVEKQYFNELGNPAAPVLDTAAFSTCP